MMRFCPNCHTERALTEIFCEGNIDNHACGWDLSSEPIHAKGWRPIAIISAEDVAQEATDGVAALQERVHCQNGHPMEEGDMICMVCGADAVDTATAISPLPAPPPSVDCGTATQIGHWKILRRINHNDSVRERYQVQHQENGQHGVLTLYAYGAEPDLAVYEVIRNLPREHIPDIIETGRWNARAWQVAEEMVSGSLADAAARGDFWQPEEIPPIVRELGSALSCFSEHGLRHRNLRPSNLLIRTRHPLDLVIIEFGSACLSEFDLDIVSPLEITCYSAPETLAGGVAAASDWWSLGIILLEQITRGRCFENIHPHAFLIQILANGVTLPEDLDPHLRLLLRGLLTRDRHQRWQWPEVQAWLDGRPVTVADDAHSTSDNQHYGITLNQRRYTQPAAFALAAAEQQHWQEALALMQRGTVVSWAQQAGLGDTLLSQLQQAIALADLNDDYRLMLVLKLLNPHMPLILQGEIVTPPWLLDHPLEGHDLLLGALPDFLGQIEPGHWLFQLKARQERVRLRGENLKIAFDENLLRIHLLATSRARLLAIWEEQRKLFPETTHHGLKTLIDRRNLNEDDLILLLSADIGQFTSTESLLVQASQLAARYNITHFDRADSQQMLTLPRAEIYQRLAERINGFNRCNIADIDNWAARFMLTRRLPLEQALVMLAIPAEQWIVPEKQRYIHQVLDFFTRKITASTMRGSLVRMSITPHAGRVDLSGLGGPKKSAETLLNHLLARSRQSISVDSQTLLTNEQTDRQLRTLQAQTQLYLRDTGINGMYLGFPFILVNTQHKQMKPRIAPLLLWPVNINMEAGIRGVASLRFDHDRGAVHLNPALENFVGIPSIKRWQAITDQLLSQAALSAEEVIESFSALVPAREHHLVRLPPLQIEMPENTSQLVCSAVLFHASFIGQAISEDLRQLCQLSPEGTSLETALGLNSDSAAAPQPTPAETCYFTAASDPSQESAVLAARNAPGLLIEGPPGTGKSQTIVNMVADAIGQKRSLLIICQKPAALEVVFKRIMAGGLSDRVVMVKDAQKDRDALIRNVRAQLETLYKPADTSNVNPWVTSREKTGRHLDQLEQELDSYYQALYQQDATTGISYRDVLSELMVLETHVERLELPALQPILSDCSLEHLEEIKQAIIPVITLWLEAGYEQSPLAQLRPFLSHQATLQEFTDRFTRFCQVEQQRDRVLANPHHAFDVTEPDEHQQSLTACRTLLASLPPAEWMNLAQWLPLFYAHNGSTVQGEQLLMQMEQLFARLQEIDSSGSDPLMFEPLAQCDSPRLVQLIAAAEEAQKRTFFQNINPCYYLRRRRLTLFLQQQGLQNDHNTVARLLISARSEQQWRSVRTELNRFHQRLGLSPVGLLDNLALAHQLGSTLQTLRGVYERYQQLSGFAGSHRMIPTIIEHQQAGFDEECAEIAAAIARCQAREASATALENLRDWLEISTAEAFTQAIQHNRPLTASLDAITRALPSLAAYQQFRPVAAQLDPVGLAILKTLRQQETALAQVEPKQLALLVAQALDREMRLVWKQQLEWRSPILLQEQSAISDKIAELTKLDSQMRGLNKLELTQVIKTTAISPLRQWEEITRLTGKRARRLREFIEQGSALGLMQLRPVWLMTPDVASQILPLKAGLFDTVIYDEASQMPVEYALPTLFRSRHMVVSGDEKQMPPSTFFSGKTMAEDDPDDSEDLFETDSTQQEEVAESWNYRQISDCPDLLHLARTVLPAQTLAIHYRSAYRELINFSNHAFYENQLNIPVQHSSKVIDAAKPVSLMMVNGLYQNQSNQQEAEQVATLLAEMWQKPYAERPSVGVVTFNQKQAQLIQNVLEARAEQNEAFRQAYRQEQQRQEEDEDMSFFVKNVENVQGDERDVIIFSTTFGRNQQGTFRRNFGILGQRGGERRLNVAVTRARNQVRIVSSMPIEEISDLLATHRQPDIPRDFLQGYLEYARRLSSGAFSHGQALLTRMNRTELASRAQTPQHDGFVHSVMAYIRSQGWSIAESQQNGAFYFDCIIEDPLTGRYLLGIECDMPRHPLLQRARARELWRPSILKRVTTFRHRISIQQWYHHGSEERLRLQQAITQAIGTERGPGAITAHAISEENT
ncbi:AAA domain-containing protein [Serratia fonticola]|uniref:AAA domain-containing protein n=1 Tax=Serratia fonticola TaxID=47917 RepID=A0A542BGY7_SERFO|nr:AAA domain-containing protein [Serratia fonticola]TQI77813.1 AAA domain-containing protein [Serratia fonticola]TQI95191.1 AAA domain-containing protein [Serratia fonticola]TVZ69689.1 AAA domain-containing protein [Serratia fonticola]